MKGSASILYAYRMLFPRTGKKSNARRSLTGAFLCIAISLVPLVMILTVSNGMINRCRIMQGKILDDYLEKLQNRDITKYMLSDTFFRKIKKILFKLFPKLYIKIFYSRG